MAGQQRRMSFLLAVLLDFSHLDTQPSVFGRIPCLFACPHAYLALSFMRPCLACLLYAILPTFAFWMMTLLTSLFKFVLCWQYYKKLTSYCYIILVHLYSGSRQAHINFTLISTNITCGWQRPLLWLQCWHTCEDPPIPHRVKGLWLGAEGFLQNPERDIWSAFLGYSKSQALG